MTETVGLQRAWLERLRLQRGVTRTEVAELLHRLDGSHGNLRDVVRAATDPEVLQLWYAARDSGDPDIVGLRNCCWAEIRRRARDALAETA